MQTVLNDVKSEKCVMIRHEMTSGIAVLFIWPLMVPG